MSEVFRVNFIQWFINGTSLFDQLSLLFSTRTHIQKALESPLIMAAAQAVAETYELLEMIIIYIPADRIKSLRRVLKNFKAFIGASIRIRRARTMAPSRRTNAKWLPPKAPIYASEDNIKMHHKMARKFGQLLDNRSRINIYFIDRKRASILDKLRNDYATHPRCQELVMYNVFTKGHCTVYRESGIKIGDLLDAREDLLMALSKRRYSRDLANRYQEVRVELTESL